MGVQKFVVRLTPIAAEIKRATAKLRRIKPRLDKAGKQKIAKDIDKLEEIARILPCKKMTSIYPAPPSED